MNVKFEGDSKEYEQLKQAASQIRGVEGLVLEIGTRLGRGIYEMMQACAQNKDHRYFIGIDPYGGTHYSDQMLAEFLANMYSYCLENNMLYRHFLLDDAEFMAQYPDGITVYEHDSNKKSVGQSQKADHNQDGRQTNNPLGWRKKKLINTYALIHVDGSHKTLPVIAVTEFFIPRVSVGGFIVYDDVGMYNHSIIDNVLIKRGFKVVTRGGTKITYKKTKDE